MNDITGFNRRRRELAKQHAVLEELTYNELRAFAKNSKIEGYSKMNKEELIRTLKG